MQHELSTELASQPPQAGSSLGPPSVTSVESWSWVRSLAKTRPSLGAQARPARPEEPNPCLVSSLALALQGAEG